MKSRIVVLALIAAAVAAFSSPSWAFTPVARTTVTATVTTFGSKIAAVTVKIRNVGTPFGADQTQIAWSGVTPPSTQWKIADQFILLNATITDVGGGVQIYTRNMDADAVPAFVDPTPLDGTNVDSNPAGLLLGTSGTTGTRLQVAWSIKAASATVGTNLLPADPKTGPETGVGNRYQWLFMADKNTPAIPSTDTSAFSNGAESVTAINVSGLHTAAGPAGFFAHPDGQNSFLYLQGEFTTAAALQTYQTRTLTIESFLQ